MLAAYIFCLVVGGGFLLLSLFGDFLEADADVDLDGDADLAIGDAGDVAKLFSLRAIVYALFGFGASGTLLHLVWEGTSRTDRHRRGRYRVGHGRAHRGGIRIPQARKRGNHAGRAVLRGAYRGGVA